MVAKFGRISYQLGLDLPVEVWSVCFVTLTGFVIGFGVRKIMRYRYL